MIARLALCAAGALVVLAPAQAQDLAKKNTTLHGGPLDRIVMGPIVQASDGKPGFGLKPSKPNASPVPASLAPQITALLKAYATGDAAAEHALLADATAELCDGLDVNCRPAKAGFEDQFEEHCTPNTPFFVPEGQVRLEWLYKGQLYYISFVDFHDGKVAHIRTMVAEVPAIFNPKASGSNG